MLASFFNASTFSVDLASFANANTLPAKKAAHKNTFFIIKIV
jgi:hypothetical protein